MTKQEFESITNMTVNPAVYCKIEQVYMDSKSNKVDFCFDLIYCYSKWYKHCFQTGTLPIENPFEYFIIYELDYYSF